MAGVTFRTNDNGTIDELDGAGRIIKTIDPINRKETFANGAFLDLTASPTILALANSTIITAHLAPNAVTAAKLTSTMATGYTPLALGNWRKVATNDVPNIAASGGILAKDTDPVFERINVATDKNLRLKWAAGSQVEIFYAGEIEVPSNLDVSSPLVLCVEALMAGATDTPTLAYGYWPGIGGSNGGGNTGALSATRQKYTVNVAAPGAYPIGASITLIPGAHATDALYVLSTWLEYLKK